MTTRFMCSLVIMHAVQHDILPGLGAAAPEMLWDPTAKLVKRVQAGERADGIVATNEALAELIGQGFVDAASLVPVAEGAFGVAVRSDMPTPPLATEADLVKLLLEVPSIVYSRAGASGIYFEKLIDVLGIGEAVRAKSTVIPAGLTGEKVKDGTAVLAIQQMSELIAVDGIQIVGPLPPENQQPTYFSAAVFSGAADAAGARAFIAALTSPAARDAYTRIGLKA